MDNNLRNNYDPDMYKPKTDQMDLSSPVAKVANRSFLAEEKEQLFRSDKRNFKGKQRFIDFKLFVALDPTEKLSGKSSRTMDKTVIFLGIYVAVWLAFTILSFRAIQALFRLPVWVTVIIYLVGGIAIGYGVLSRFVYKTEDKRRQRAITQGNKMMNLGSVWGINPGGILEGKALGKKHTTVYYQGKEAIVLKILKKSVLVSNDTADWSHYEGLQLLEDTMAKNGLSWTKINSKYDTENDYIWDELNDSLAQSSMLYGKKYTDMMNKFFIYQRNMTKAISTVPVIYYIIKPEFINPKKSYKQIIAELYTIVTQRCRCTLGPVSNKEFLRLLKNYYGVSYLDVDTIAEFISTATPLNFQVNVISYLNNKGEVIELKDEYSPDLPNKYSILEYIPSEIDIEEEPEIQLSEKYSIYGDKTIRQYGS